jgi:glycerol-3-phosphate dehydrogenase
VLLLDKNYDVGEATSKGNSAIVHTGFDAAPGTLESQLVTEASRRWPELAEKLKIPYEPCGALLLAIDEEQREQLDEIHARAVSNGVDDVEVLSADQTRELEPGAPDDVRGGLLIPREAIADPFATCVAYAEVALGNGTDILLGTEIVGIEDADKTTSRLVTATGQLIATRFLVNVAGLGSRRLADLYGGDGFDINPRRGQFLVFDEYDRSTIKRILLPIPTAHTKGVLVIPTVFGSVLAGPSAEDLALGAERVTDTTIEMRRSLLSGALRLFPGLIDQPVIAMFAGVRCNCSQGSYLIRCNDGHHGILTVTGIRSTGFTSSPALAEYLIGELREKCGLDLRKDPEASDSRPESSWPVWWKRPHADRDTDRESVEECPDRGSIVCYCENVSRGDITRHLDSPLKPRTLDAIKRRTRTQMGRCQGFDCQVQVAQIISDHCGIPLNEITKNGPGSELGGSQAS